MRRGLSRRLFLIAGAVGTGGLLVGLGAPKAQDRLGAPDSLPAHQGEVGLNGWVKIDANGLVTVAVPRAEMGQGVMTALPMLLVEELGARWEDVRVEPAPVAQIYANQAMMLNVLPFGAEEDGLLARMARASMQRIGHVLHLQITGGSSSIRDAWEPLRLAGATARLMLAEAAARRWGVPASACRVEAGQVWHPTSGAHLGFGELAPEAAKLTPPDEVRLKDPSAYRLIGKPMPRHDVPAKVNGSAVYGIDVRMPGLLYAAIAQPPVFGAKVASLDAGAAEKMRGVRQVLNLPQGVVVVADSWWRAKQALAQVKVAYAATPDDQVSSADIVKRFKTALANESGLAFKNQGDASSALSQAAKVIEASYWAPYLAHSAMEPINCTARVKDGQVELWLGTQSPSLATWRAAQVAGVDTKQVTLHQLMLGGGFGRRLEVDMVVQAVSIAMQMPGQAVKLLWTREEDTQHDMYRPAAMSVFKAGLDRQGQVTAWQNRLAAQSMGRDAIKRLLPWAASDTPDTNHIEGAFDLPYAFEHIEVRQVRTQAHVPVGSWRSVGHSYNAFFVESFIDELAHATGQDPLAYRRSLLQAHPRHRAVLELAASKAGWGQPRPAGRALGLALHESYETVCAQVAEVSVQDGALKVHRVVCAIDCGVVVNPDTVEAQVQGAIVYGLSAALFGEITLAQGRVEQSSFPNYDALRLAGMPLIETHIVPSTHAPGGVGEPGTPPIAPAVTNALFALTGQRIRALPIRLEAKPSHA